MPIILKKFPRSHVALPLCIFYRFHSSVALADIWGSAYRPGNHHH